MRDLNTDREVLSGGQRELEEAYAHLRKVHSQMLQQDKMASIGQLAAGVAHEINNPVGFIMSNLNSLQRYSCRIMEFLDAQSAAVSELMHGEKGQRGEIAKKIERLRQDAKIDFIMEDMSKLIKESLEGAERVKNIVLDLKGFSRSEESELKPNDINAGIESTINIVWNELKYKAALKRHYGDIPLTRCNLGQLNQVFMNLLMNAVQAIKDNGEITVRTWADGGNIYIAVSDTGCGIPEQNLGRIFDPFFTTKEVGSGTGLGLSMSYDIIKEHKGDIKVESRMGEGATFTVRLPITS